MKNILVFGGLGFLGSYLVNELSSRGYKVTVADINLKGKRIDGVNYAECDISSIDDVEKVFGLENFQIVYNLAGFANLDDAIKAPLKTIELNVISNMYILEACIKRKNIKYVYASSAYAMSNKGSFYGISKLASEKIIEEYHNRYDLPFVILRYGSVYSEMDFGNNYVYNLVKGAVLDNKIDHRGDGNEIREYIHAADAAKLSVDVIEDDSFDNRHIILTGSERMKRSELFEMINEIMNNKVSIKYSQSGTQHHYKFTPYSFQPSVSKKLVANPHIDMGQGILECVRAVYENET